MKLIRASKQLDRPKETKHAETAHSCKSRRLKNESPANEKKQTFTKICWLEKGHEVNIYFCLIRILNESAQQKYSEHIE